MNRGSEMAPTLSGMLGGAAIFVLVICVLSSSVSALPTTGAATLIGTNNATLAATGVTTTGWFEWGQYQNSLYWRTSNVTASAGAISYPFSVMFVYIAPRFCVGIGVIAAVVNDKVLPHPVLSHAR